MKSRLVVPFTSSLDGEIKHVCGASQAKASQTRLAAVAATSYSSLDIETEASNSVLK